MHKNVPCFQTSSFNPNLNYQQNLSGSPSGIIANIRAIHPSTLFPPSLPFGVQARNKSPIPCFFYTLDLAVVPYWGSKSADFLSALAWKSAENLPCSSETNNPNSRDFTHSQYFNWNLIWWFVLEPLSHGFIHHIEAWTIKPLCRSSISLPFPPLSDFYLPPSFPPSALDVSSWWIFPTWSRVTSEVPSLVFFFHLSCSVPFGDRLTLYWWPPGSGSFFTR